MRIFEREEEFEEDEDSSKKKRFLKKVRDLNPQNRKRRKEPVKPWDKKERVIVFVFFLLTVLISGILSLSARSWKLPNLPRFEIPNFKIFKSETVVIGPNKDVQKKKSEEIKSHFSQETKTLTGTYSFYVINLEHDFEFGYREKTLLQAASLVKLPVFIALYQKEEKKDINLDDIYSLKNSDLRGGSGSLQYKSPGTKISYREMAKLMGKQSDNTTFNVFRNILTDAKIQEVIEEIGMLDTSLKENKTNAYDIGIFYKKLWQEEIVSKEHKNEILEYLTDTYYEEYIPKGILGVRVAHKYGRETNVVNDAGIVYAQEPFVLVVLSEGIIKNEADEFIPAFAKFVYENMN